MCIYFLTLSAESKETPIAVSTPTAHILVSNTIAHKRKLGLLEKQLIPRLEQKRKKISLEHLVIQESNEVLKKNGGDIS